LQRYGSFEDYFPDDLGLTDQEIGRLPAELLRDGG